MNSRCLINYLLDAIGILARLSQASGKYHVSAYHVALIHIALGDLATGLTWLARL